MARFDAYSARDVETALKGLIDGGAQKIVCDFSGTEYISSAGLRVLLSAAKILRKSGGKIVLAGMKPYVREVFETAGFTQLFPIFESEEKALASLK
ncbi:MAG: STAS domain-containing protein [Candidatus Aureabacteria bacterium]|nr:STAS domain-containing protein [Candidatus Auribacterota bacterium]